MDNNECNESLSSPTPSTSASPKLSPSLPSTLPSSVSSEETNKGEEARDRSSSESSVSSNDSLFLGLPVALVSPSTSRSHEVARGSIDFSSMSLDTQTIDANLSLLPTFTKFDEQTESSDDEPCASKLNGKRSISSLNLSNNRLTSLPLNLVTFTNLTTLDISENGLESLEPMIHLPSLTSLIACNNKLNEDSLSKASPSKYIPKLKVLSLSGNQFRTIPDAILNCAQLRSLYLGANQIEVIPKTIIRLTNLRFLYLGGNRLTEIPDEVGCLNNLEALSLCENKISRLPTTIARLTNLRSLALHMNQLTTLPTEIVRLRSLSELSLRNNPLVVRFINDYMYNPPSLLELAGRCIKINKIHYSPELVPHYLNKYLQTAQRCVNPKCKGVYFDSRIEQIKFVDFCGSYRLPLLQYLCSPKCTKPVNPIESSEDESELFATESKIKRVLLG